MKAARVPFADGQVFPATHVGRSRVAAVAVTPAFRLRGRLVDPGWVTVTVAWAAGPMLFRQSIPFETTAQFVAAARRALGTAQEAARK